MEMQIISLNYRCFKVVSKTTNQNKILSMLNTSQSSRTHWATVSSCLLSSWDFIEIDVLSGKKGTVNVKNVKRYEMLNIKPITQIWPVFLFLFKDPLSGPCFHSISKKKKTRFCTVISTRERQRLMCCESLTVRAPRTTGPTSQSSQHFNEYGQKNKELQPNERIIKARKA